jgi:hypothetical protein
VGLGEDLLVKTFTGGFAQSLGIGKSMRNVAWYQNHGSHGHRPGPGSAPCFIDACEPVVEGRRDSGFRFRGHRFRNIDPVEERHRAFQGHWLSLDVWTGEGRRVSDSPAQSGPA